MGKIKVVEFEQELRKMKKVSICLTDIQRYIPSIDLVYTESKFEELDANRKDCEIRFTNNQICSKAVQEIVKEVFNPSLLIYKIMGVDIKLVLREPGNIVWSDEKKKWIMNVDSFDLVCEKYSLKTAFFPWSTKIPDNTDNIIIKTHYLGENPEFDRIFNVGERQEVDGSHLQTLSSVLTNLRDFILNDYHNNQELYTNSLYKEQNINL